MDGTDEVAKPPGQREAEAAKTGPMQISRLTYLLPFGRYVGSSEVGPGADEVLVGREGHRAFFVDLLISAGRNGAFLVTGRRGAGKTSFVRHCIAEYEASVFKRFLRHNIGRAFWDRVVVLLFWALLLLGGLLLSEMAQLLAPLATQETPHRMLVWFVLLPIGIALLFPCVYARAAFEVVIDTLNLHLGTEDTRFSKVAATGIVLVAGAFLWFLRGLSSPAWSISALFTLLTALYLGAQNLSLQWRTSTGQKPEPTSKYDWCKDQLVTLIRWSAVALLASASIATMSLAFGPSSLDVELLWDPILTNLAAGCFLLGSGLELRGWYQSRLSYAYFQSSQQGGKRENKEDDPTRLALRRGGANYSVPALTLTSAGAWLAGSHNLEPALVPTLAVTLAFLIVGLVRIELAVKQLRGKTGQRRGGLTYRPPSQLILLAGALVSIVLALQLAHPVLKPVFQRSLERFSLGGNTLSYLKGSSWPGAGWLASELQPMPTSLAGVPRITVQEAELLSKKENALVAPASERVIDRSKRSQRKDSTILGWSVFGRRSEALLWLGLTSALFMLLHFIQYEWIVRPHVAIRESDPAELEARAPWEDGECWGIEGDFPKEEPDKRWRTHRKMAELTLPWAVYRIWLPTMVAEVNLGLDPKLRSDQVIQAMLVGLRDIYHRTFTSFTAGPANIGRLGALLGILIAVTLAGDTWFELPSADDVRKSVQKMQDRSPTEQLYVGTSPCAILKATQEVRSLRPPDLACRLGEGWFDLLYMDLAPSSLRWPSSQTTAPHPRFTSVAPEHQLLLYALVPYRSETNEAAADKPNETSGSPNPDAVPADSRAADRAADRWRTLFPTGIHLNVYHLLLFFGFVVLARSTARRLPLLPYRQNLKRIDDLLDGMTARTRVTQRPTIWEPARWIYNLVADRVQETEREPFDPRTIELAFLHILNDIQGAGLRMPGIARSHLNLPSPEITFVFDELDKLGPRLDPEGESVSALATELRALQADQERALQLRRLLSDLKNVLSSAPARFIFIGGRNLHDEWLADQTARQPLLTNIFIAEVYLPSLLTDRAKFHPGPHRLHTRIEQYVVLQHRRARALYADFSLKAFRPSFGLTPSSLSHERFATSTPVESLETELSTQGIFKIHDGVPEEIDQILRLALVEDLIAFLTLRSMGNPKRLKELMASFIRPVGHEVQASRRWQLPCRHVLRLRDQEMIRIQLIASIYRQLAGVFETRMVQRDDKMAISTFFLSDFLFKFHRRAFSWANLERVDELAHIHRAPDLRDIQEEMVQLVSERFLHRILNGMYSFRFRSDVAREVEYLSRRSSAEMAALNFTLDESQSLKATYHGALERREQQEGSNVSLVAGLGELYEFDQEYETARHHYRHAIDLLDDRLCKKAGARNAVREALRGTQRGVENVRVFLPWGESRLRLMLQIGMTFEIARNLEHAATEYRAARTLARALVRACLALDISEDQTHSTSPEKKFETGRFHTLKHLNILFQPLFAEAWASEKIISSVDTSNQLLETGLWEIRRILPFVQCPKLALSKDPIKPAHANLALTISQLHNKAGDLYFFKGRQPVQWKDMVEPEFWSGDARSKARRRLVKPAEQDRPTDGYLLRAHYHYAVSLHEIRRYTHHRINSSEYRLSLAADGGTTLIGEALPDFLSRAIASSVNDMAEATLGRVSLYGLLRSLLSYPPDQEIIVDELKTALLEWLKGSDSDTRHANNRVIKGIDDKPSASLSNWLGGWNRKLAFKSRYPEDSVRLIAFTGPDSYVARFIMSIHLCRAGAAFFERGGYLEDAARELLQVSTIVCRLLWWLRMTDALGSCSEMLLVPGYKVEDIKNFESAVFGDTSVKTRRLATATLERHLIKFTIADLRRVGELFYQARPKIGHLDDSAVSNGSHVGRVIPPDALTLACSLGLLLADSQDENRQDRQADLWRLIIDWKETTKQGNFADTLRSSLERERYPLLNRLNALQVLVDDYSLSSSGTTSFDVAETHLAELLDLKEQYDAPLHFTPHQSGTTCALFRLKAEKDNRKSPFLDRVLRTAQKDLRASEEMCTLQRAFYESISDLYYLYDDFNDRHIHFKHALQMAGLELTTLLQQLLKVEERTNQNH